MVDQDQQPKQRGRRKCRSQSDVLEKQQHQSQTKQKQGHKINNNDIKKKVVHINTLKISILQIPHCADDFSPEERSKSWYSKQELDRTLKEARDTVIAMQATDGVVVTLGMNSNSDEEVNTSRGLEYMTPSGFDITTSSLEAVQLVLEEQARQQKEGASKKDDELLACAIASISRHRSRIAHLAAMKDARTIYGMNFSSDGTGASTGSAGATTTASRREPRRGQLRSTSSTGQLTEKTRRRRGSRGPLKERTSRHHKQPHRTKSLNADQIITPTPTVVPPVIP